MGTCDSIATTQVFMKGAFVCPWHSLLGSPARGEAGGLPSRGAPLLTHQIQVWIPSRGCTSYKPPGHAGKLESSLRISKQGVPICYLWGTFPNVLNTLISSSMTGKHLFTLSLCSKLLSLAHEDVWGGLHPKSSLVEHGYADVPEAGCCTHGQWPVGARAVSRGTAPAALHTSFSAAEDTSLFHTRDAVASMALAFGSLGENSFQIYFALIRKEEVCTCITCESQ